MYDLKLRHKTDTNSCRKMVGPTAMSGTTYLILSNL